MPKRKTEEVGYLSKSEKTKLNRLYTEGSAAYGSLKNLVKASKLPENKVRHFLESKTSYTRYNQPTRRFTRLKTFAKHINEIWCMDLAFVDQLAEFNNDYKYLLVCIDVFSRFVRVQPMKNKTSKETLKAFQKMVNSKTKPEKLWVDKGTEFAKDFRNFCNQKNILRYSIMSETKAALAERAIRSLKNIIFRFMEDNGYKFIHKLQNFVNTMNSRVNRSIGLKPKDVKNSNVLSILYNYKFMSHKKPKFKPGDFVRITKEDIPFRKGYRAQYTSEVFKIVKITSLKPVTYLIEDLDGEIVKGKFYDPELKKCTI